MFDGDLGSELRGAGDRTGARSARGLTGLPEFSLTNAAARLRLFLQNGPGGPRLGPHRNPGPAGSVRLALEQERDPYASSASEEAVEVEVHVPEVFRLAAGNARELTLAMGETELNVRLDPDRQWPLHDGCEFRDLVREAPHDVLGFYDSLTGWLAHAAGDRSYRSRAVSEPVESIETLPDAARYFARMVHPDTIRLHARVALPLDDTGRLSEQASYSFGLSARFQHSGDAGQTLQVTPYPADFLVAGKRFEQARRMLRSENALNDLAGTLIAPEAETNPRQYIDEQLTRNLVAVFALERPHPAVDPGAQTAAALIRSERNRRLLIYFRMRWKKDAAQYQSGAGVWYRSPEPGARARAAPGPEFIDALIENHLKRIAVEYHRWQAGLI